MTCVRRKFDFCSFSNRVPEIEVLSCQEDNLRNFNDLIEIHQIRAGNRSGE